MRMVNATFYSYSSPHASPAINLIEIDPMSTLTNQAYSAVVARLFAEADASDAALGAQRDALSPEELARLMGGTEDYQSLYRRLKDFHLAVSRETATLLYMLARSCRASSIVEFGTSFGVSTLHLAAALRDNGGGRLISTEFEPTKVSQASANVAAAGLADLVEIRSGDALETLSRALPERIDLVLLDGAKGLYPKVLSLLESRLRPGALVVADNADWSAEYLARVRDPAGAYRSVPFANDVEVSLKL
jgi:predicted O-methyltransferase YrrM